MIEVALIQRICPHYRVPVWRKLAQADEIDLTVYYGRGEKTGSQQNAKNISGFKHKQLFTLGFPFRFRGRSIFVAFHPTLLFHLWKNKYDVVICEGPSNIINNLFILPYFLLSRVPFVWWDAGRNPDAPRRLLRRLFDPILNFFIRHSSACIAYGSLARSYLISVGASPAKVFVAQNALDTEKIRKDLQKYDKRAIIEKRKQLGIENKKVILYVGALEKRKKLDMLIDVFADVKTKLKEAALLIVGDGTERQRLEEYVRDSGVTNVLFLGRIVEEVGLLFLLSDVLVLPSEGGLSINQAMGYGLPVIVSTADGTEVDLVKNGETGFLFEKNNAEDLSKKIRLVLSKKDVATYMSEKAMSLIHGEYTLDNMVKGIVKAVEYAHRTIQ